MEPVRGGAHMPRQPFGHSIAFRWFLGHTQPSTGSSGPISSFAAVEYSNSTLLEAEHVLLGLTSFVEDARAYVKGQLTCGPVGESGLWER